MHTGTDIVKYKHLKTRGSLNKAQIHPYNIDYKEKDDAEVVLVKFRKI